ncbi:MAG: DNA primase [Verrucomicrobiota bacterium]
MGLISEETKHAVLEATDIVDLIESYFPLKRAGTMYKALCPFHNESTPSFNVNPGRQIFKCFGCGMGGDAITFVREYEKVDFSEAVRRLAQRVGITVQEEAMDAASIARLKLRDQILEVQREAAKWFQKQLFTMKGPEGYSARAYLKGRGIDRDIAERWWIGYAPQSGDSFLDWARERKFSGKALAASGLAGMRNPDQPQAGLYAFFTGRIMFPVANEQNEVIAFSARLLDPEAKAAKYINSRESPVFLKKKTFFGFDKTRQPIIKAKHAIVCEGQIDLITCFEHGIENVIAPMGTAFTEDHAAVLKRFTSECVLCFDADNAGLNAADKTFAVLAPQNFEVRCVDMPTGEDPDSLIRAGRLEEFRTLLSEAKPHHDFKIDRMSASFDLTSASDRVRFANEMAESIARLTDPVARDAVVHNVATRLGTSAEEILKRVSNLRIRPTNNNSREEKDEGETIAPLKIENKTVLLLCKLALTDSATKRWLDENREEAAVLKEVPESEFLAKVWQGQFDPETPASVNGFLDSLTGPETALASTLLIERSPGQGLDDARRALAKLSIQRLELQLQTAQSKLRDKTLENAEILALTSQIWETNKEIVDRKSQL